MLFAQTEMVVSGWLSLIVQTGSLGLLAYVIVKVLPWFHESIIKERADERKDFRAAIEQITVTFKGEISHERQSCEKHFEALATSIKSGNDATIAAIHNSAEQVHQHAMRNMQFNEILENLIRDKGKT